MNIWCYIILAISIVIFVTLIIMVSKENFQCDNNHCNTNDDNISIHALTNHDLPLHMF